MKIWKLLFQSLSVISFLFFTLILNAGVLSPSEPEGSLVIESAGSKLRPCSSKFGFAPSSTVCSILYGFAIDVKITAKNGTFSNVYLTGSILSHVSVSSPDSSLCTKLTNGQTCTYTLIYDVLPNITISGIVNVVGNNRVVTNFTLDLIAA